MEMKFVLFLPHLIFTLTILLSSVCSILPSLLMSKTRKICLGVAFAQQHDETRADFIMPSWILLKRQIYLRQLTRSVVNQTSKGRDKKSGWDLPKIFLWWPVGHHIKDNHELLEVDVPILEQWVTTKWTVKAWKLLMIFDLSVTFIYRPRFSNSRPMCAHVFVLLFINSHRFANVLKCYQRWKSVIFLLAEETLTSFINSLCQGHLLVIHGVKIILVCTCMDYLYFWI